MKRYKQVEIFNNNEMETELQNNINLGERTLKTIWKFWTCLPNSKKCGMGVWAESQ